MEFIVIWFIISVNVNLDILMITAVYSSELFLAACVATRNITTGMNQLDVLFLILYSGWQSIKQVIF